MVTLLVVLACVILIGFLTYKSFTKMKKREKTTRVVNFNGSSNRRYRATLKNGRSGTRATDWYYHMYDGDDLIEIFDVILYMMLWDLFEGEEGDYQVDDISYYVEEEIESIRENQVQEEMVPEVIDEPVQEPVVSEPTPVEETTTSDDSDSYSSNDSSYESSSSDSYSSSDSSYESSSSDSYSSSDSGGGDW